MGGWVGTRASVNDLKKVKSNVIPRKRFVMFGRAEFKEYHT
jgi:hypothetical protein